MRACMVSWRCLDQFIGQVQAMRVCRSFSCCTPMAPTQAANLKQAGTGNSMYRMASMLHAWPKLHHAYTTAPQVGQAQQQDPARGRAQVEPSISPSKIRNACIIAHIDHGKTTLADQLLKQAWALDSHNGSRSSDATLSGASLDSGELERERGITILSKVTSFSYNGHLINLVDTPGHADFGGEVERVLGLVDGAVLVVDASEGPLAQTKFVLGKALARGLAPLVLLNKVDKPSATAHRCSLVESSLFDLFAALGASDTQLDFPLLYASARQGWADRSLPAPGSPPPASMQPLLDKLISHVPPPPVTLDAPFRMSAAMVSRDPYVGRIVTGRVHSGQVRPGDVLRVLSPPHALAQPDSTPAVSSGSGGGELHKVVRLIKRMGMEDVLVPQGVAGDIISVAGVPAAIGDTLADVQVSQPLDTARVDPPTLRMVFSANDSPFAGKAGKAVTGRVIGEVLAAAAECSVSLTVQQLPGATERYEVCARGEMQLAVLIEEMRRQGMEAAVSPPAVLNRVVDGHVHEPLEEVIAEVDEGVAGQVIELLSVRRAELLDMQPVQGGRQRLVFTVPSRGLIGFKPIFVNLTRGEGLLSREFKGYAPYKGAFTNVRKGVLVSNAEGAVTRHALTELQQRGVFFVTPGELVVQDGSERMLAAGMACSEAETRASGCDECVVMCAQVPLAAARLLTLEEAIGYVAGDELIEVTPEAVRIRKTELNMERRKQAARLARTRGPT